MKTIKLPGIILAIFAIALLASIYLPAGANAASSTIVINEVLHNPSGTEIQGEWIELYNRSSSTVDMTNWVLTDLDTSTTGRGTSFYNDGVFIFPPINVPPGGYVVVRVGRGTDDLGYFNNDYYYNFSAGDYSATLYWGRSSGGLNNSGEQIVLLSPIDNVLPVYDDTTNYIRGEVVDFLTHGGMASSGNNNIAIDADANGTIDADEYPGGTDFTNIESERSHEPGTNGNDEAIALDPNGDDQDGSSTWNDLAVNADTPGETNDSTIDYTSNPIYENSTGLVINEVTYNQAGDDEWLNEDDELIELYNPTNGYIHMANWTLTDLKTSTSGGNHDTYTYNYHSHVFVFPGLLVPPGGIVVLSVGGERVLSDLSFAGDNSVTINWGRDRCILNDSGDEVVLLSPINQSSPVYNDTTDTITGTILDVFIYNSIAANDGNDIIVDSNGDTDGDDPGEHAVGGVLNNHSTAFSGSFTAGDNESIALHHNAEDMDDDSVWTLETTVIYTSTTQQTANRPVSGDSITFYGDGITTGSRNDQPVSNVSSTNEVADLTGDPDVFAVGDRISYTITLSNSGDKSDGIHMEMDMPQGTTYMSSTASTGSISFSGNTVTWDGEVPFDNPTVLTIYADINENVAESGIISSQAEVTFDGWGNGTLNSTSLSDDPGTSEEDDPTTLRVTSGLPETGQNIVLLTILGAIVLTGTCILTKRKHLVCRHVR